MGHGSQGQGSLEWKEGAAEPEDKNEVMKVKGRSSELPEQKRAGGQGADW